MQNYRLELRKTFLEACAGLRNEKELSLKNTELIGALYRSNAHVNLQMTESAYLKELGLTKDQYYTRAMAARVLSSFPDFAAAYRNGQIGISVLAMIAPKITQANRDVILKNVCGKSKREARCFLSRVNGEGIVGDGEGSVELTVTLKMSDLKKLEEARSVLSAGGKLPTNTEIILKALDDLLDKRDPIRKAKRAKARREKKVEAAAVPVRTEMGKETVDGLPDRSEGKSRPAIPKNIEHSVWLRDQRRCTHQYEDGTRCEETQMLELDHRIPWARGGAHSFDNLRVVCRRHNFSYATDVFGGEFMQRFRKPIHANI